MRRGFVSYEAAPAFDPALTARRGGGFPLLWFGLYDKAERVNLPATPPGLDLGKTTWQASVGFAEFAENVSLIKELIRSGDSYQVNYSYRLRALLTAEPWDFFLHLVAAQEAPCGAFVDTGEWVIGSASPELFFRLDGDRIVSRPMKGTAGRGANLGGGLSASRGAADLGEGAGGERNDRRYGSARFGACGRNRQC